MTPWRKVDNALIRPGQSIARTGVEGVDRMYSLFGTGPESLGHWPTADEAKAAADRIRASNEAERLAA